MNKPVYLNYIWTRFEIVRPVVTHDVETDYKLKHNQIGQSYDNLFQCEQCTGQWYG